LSEEELETASSAATVGGLTVCSTAAGVAVLVVLAVVEFDAFAEALEEEGTASVGVVVVVVVEAEDATEEEADAVAGDVDVGGVFF